MQWIDLTLTSPAANLALDEALLDACESQHTDECLRFWEPQTPFVVVGYGQRIDRETFPDHCRIDQVPIHRRCSGGGTVLQAPGCLNYSLILSMTERPELESVSSTNTHVMSAHRDVIGSLLNQGVEIQGHTDLAVGGRKFSGNAQRRRRHSLLFHGTFLLSGFNLEQVGRYLPQPSLEPEYRRQRRHEEFITSLPLTSEQIRAALRSHWNVDLNPRRDWPEEAVTPLVEARYSRAEWNHRL